MTVSGLSISTTYQAIVGMLPTDRIIIPLKSLRFCRYIDSEVALRVDLQRWIKYLVYFLFT